MADPKKPRTFDLVGDINLKEELEREEQRKRFKNKSYQTQEGANYMKDRIGDPEADYIKVKERAPRGEILDPSGTVTKVKNIPLEDQKYRRVPTEIPTPVIQDFKARQEAQSFMRDVRDAKKGALKAAANGKKGLEKEFVDKIAEFEKIAKSKGFDDIYQQGLDAASAASKRFDNMAGNAASAIGRAASVAGKAGKAAAFGLPVIGGLASALASGESSAAIPFLGDSSDAGPEKGSPEYNLETGRRAIGERVNFDRSGGLPLSEEDKIALRAKIQGNPDNAFGGINQRMPVNRAVGIRAESGPINYKQAGMDISDEDKVELRMKMLREKMNKGL